MKALKICSYDKLERCKLITVFVLGIFTAIIPFVSDAQKNWNISLRNGASFSTYKLNNAKLKVGVGSQACIAYKLLTNVSIYGGYGWNSFYVENSVGGDDDEYLEKGYRYGIGYKQFIHNSNWAYQICIGGVYNHIELLNQRGESITNSKYGFGWQAETGIVIPVGQRFNITPSLRYQALSRNIDITNTSITLNYNYISTGLSFGWAF
jgi:hypothetical protein